MTTPVNDVIAERKAAATAGTATTYKPSGSRPFIVKGVEWFYESTEANADNTFDFAVEYTTDGTNFTDIRTNGAALGLLDTAAVLDVAVHGSELSVRIPANAVIRFTMVSAGTGTIPAINLCLSGAYV